MTEIEEIKTRLDIVEVIGAYTPLQKAGRTFKAACPFHPEKTPSFIVSPDRQSWHCFGACGTGGDVISFIMKREGLEFPEALRMLAERAGVRLPERRVSEEQDRTKQRLYAANEAATEWFQKLLASDSGKEARTYLEKRGLDDATLRAFSLGYSQASWEAARQHLVAYGFTDKELLDAGLLIKGDSGLHDRFRGRLMFPVWDAKGRISGFGARALDDSVPKYLNTSQTSLFDKGNTLYALDRAQQAIREEGRAVVVEGYMDVIAAHQHGFRNVVAQMGTALTDRQVRALKRLTTEVVLALDADAAGVEAAVRGHDVVRDTAVDTEATPFVSWRGLVGYQEAVSVEVRVAVLPAGSDPDEVIRGNPDDWRDLITNARPVLDFRLEMSAAAHDLADPRGRSQLVRGYLPLLSAVGDPVVRAHYIQRLSRLAQTSETELTSMLGRGARIGDRGTAGRWVGVRRPLAVRDRREDFLLALLLQHPRLRPYGVTISPDVIWETEGRQLFETWRAHEQSEPLQAAVPLELLSYYERLISWRLPVSGPAEAAQALQDCVKKLNQRRLQAQKHAIAAQIAELQEEAGPAVFGTPETTDVEPDAELEELLRRDIEIGRELHLRGRRDGNEPVESVVDG